MCIQCTAWRPDTTEAVTALSIDDDGSITSIFSEDPIHCHEQFMLDDSNNGPHIDLDFDKNIH